MRLLLVTDSYPPFVGGADRQIQMIARAMRDAGDEVQVVAPWQVGLPARETDDGITVHRVRGLITRIPWFSKDASRRSPPPFPDPATTLFLRGIVRRFRPDVVHSYGWITYSAAAALLRTKIPLLVSARDYANVCAVRNFLFHRGYVCSGPSLVKCFRCAAVTYSKDEAGNAVHGRTDASVRLQHWVRGAGKSFAAVAGIRIFGPLLRRHLSGVHSVSRFVQSVMDRYLLRVGSHRELEVPVDIIIPSFVSPETQESSDPLVLEQLPIEPYILFVGALLPQKGIWPLLGAYRRLRSPAPPLVLLGPSFYKSPTDFPAGVFYLGSVGHGTVMAAWERALFGVVPSVGAETFGNVVTEAMSRGRAVVGSRLGGIVDIIEDGVSGVLVPPGDEEALAEAMQRLIDDPDGRASLGRAARSRVELFAAARILPQFREVYRQLVANSQDTSGASREPKQQVP